MPFELCIHTLQICAVGIGSPGSLNLEMGVINKMANFDWTNVPITSRLAEMLGRPCYLENDAKCALLSEWWVGAGKGKQHVIMLTLGTGIGGGVIAHNSLVKGSTGMAAELGHMIMEIDGRLHAGTGVKGVFEAYGSATGVRERAKDALKKEVRMHPSPSFD